MLSPPQTPAEGITRRHLRPIRYGRLVVLSYLRALNKVSTYLLLRGDGELVAGDQARHLLHAQIEELFTPNHLGEMLLCQAKHGMKISSTMTSLNIVLLPHAQGYGTTHSTRSQQVEICTREPA